MNIYDYWKAVLKQDADAMRQFFSPNAYVRWHNTNEHFTVEEFLRANCEYPGEWDGEVERIERAGSVTITVTHVFALNKPLSFHVTSFLKVVEDKIISIDEYWGDDGDAPQWRSNKKIGTAIQKQAPQF